MQLRFQFIARLFRSANVNQVDFLLLSANFHRFYRENWSNLGLPYKVMHCAQRFVILCAKKRGKSFTTLFHDRECSYNITRVSSSYRVSLGFLELG